MEPIQLSRPSIVIVTNDLHEPHNKRMGCCIAWVFDTEDLFFRIYFQKQGVVCSRADSVSTRVNADATPVKRAWLEPIQLEIVDLRDVTFAT